MTCSDKQVYYVCVYMQMNCLQFDCFTIMSKCYIVIYVHIVKMRSCDTQYKNFLWYISLVGAYVCMLVTTHFYNLGFATTCFEVEKTMHSFGLYRIIFLCAMGISALFSLVITVKVNLIILCAMFLMFAPLHLMISCCSNPRPYIFNEIPIHFLDEWLV